MNKTLRLVEEDTSHGRCRYESVRRVMAHNTSLRLKPIIASNTIESLFPDDVTNTSSLKSDSANVPIRDLHGMKPPGGK